MDNILENKVILIAEDEVMNFTLLNEVFKKKGMRIIKAVNGQEAVDQFVENKDDIDIILMDIKMPEKNGYDATREIKAINNDVPVIAQTAYAMSGERNLSIEAGCDAYITKPVIIKELVDLVRSLI
ncbi:MAG: response regulator [Bacteroidota bacterium]|nr:response regulator [Bacteroidota bacterium]